MSENPNRHKVFVSVRNEQIVRNAIFGIDGEMCSKDLVDRIQAQGIERSNAYNLVSRAVRVGLLIRRLGDGGHFYLHNIAYVHGQVQPEVTTTQAASLGVYTGPAFDQGPLVPHLGTPVGDDDELPPCVGERYRDTTRRIYQRAFIE